MISFKVPGQPVGKGRPRFGNGRTYTPAKTVKAEAFAAMCAGIAFPYSEPLGGPLLMRVTFCMSIPKSWAKLKQMQAQQGEIRPTTTPDIDNLIKLVGDALNGVIYLDDKQIVEVQAVKRYALQPRTEIEIHNR